MTETKFTLRCTRKLRTMDIEVFSGSLIAADARVAAMLIVDGVARLADPGDARRLQDAVDELDRRQAA